MHLHQFLGHVHDVLRPATYLEVGVQYGTSLKQARYSETVIGIDPAPLITEEQASAQLPDASVELWACESDYYFSHTVALTGPPVVDLGFIDGLHHFEQALRDFFNIEKYAHSKSFIIFDDVLPRNQEEASRDQCPGDWTGDVWKVIPILREARPELHFLEVDTAPTGTLVVYGWSPYGPYPRPFDLDSSVDYFMDITEVPEDILGRKRAVSPEYVIELMREFWA